MADGSIVDRLSLRRWVEGNVSKYIVWDPATLLVPARGDREAERVAYSERRHVIALFVDAWAWMLASLLGPFLLLRVGNEAAGAIIGLLLFGAQVRLGWHILEWTITRIMITDRRVIEFGGFLRRSGGSMPLSKLTDLAFEQTFAGLLLDYGMVRVESAGQDQALSQIKYLRHPVLFQEELVARAIR